MRFAAPESLALLAFLPALALLGWMRVRAARRALAAFADAPTAARLARDLSPRRRIARGLLRLAAVACVVVALARPQGGEEERRERRPEGVDLFVALDVSRSMMAPVRSDRADAPTRLAVARQFIDRLVRSLPGDRIGLIVFAGEAFTYCPLTHDRGMILEFLSEVDPDVISTQGTNFEAALAVAIRSFGDRDATPRARHVLLVTDGEDHSPAALDMAREATAAGITIHGVAFGDERAVPIPTTPGRYLLDAEGRIVQSAVRVDSLRALAAVGEGLAWQVQGGASIEAELERLRDRLAPSRTAPTTAGTAADDVTFVVEAEHFIWFVLVALALLFLEAMIPERSARRAAALIDYRYS